MSRFQTFLLVGLAAVGLTVLFWLPLWKGGGFVGGDVYPYYFPQKVFYSERLADGELPLWNNRTGHGYPLLGESQTGVFYPFHLLTYRFLDTNTAYNVVHLLHYVMAFVFAFLYARRFGLELFGALFCGLVYTYGWFPSRVCVEWAIIGGAWLPAALWCAESFLITRRWRYAVGLSIVLALQLLAGHFVIAFITQLTLAVYIIARLSLSGKEFSDLQPSRKRRIVAVVAASVVLGFGLAAVQLFPSWELKQHSQRAEVGKHHELDFGSIPPRYLAQVVAPWYWYSAGINPDAGFNERTETNGPRTNKIEAHLFFGTLPLALAIWAAALSVVKRDRRGLLWCALGLASLVYTTGWLLPLTKHLPGFSFFQGPGRYGVVTTLAVGILAGQAFQALFRRDVLSILTAVLLTLVSLASLFSVLLLFSLRDTAGPPVTLLLAGLAFAILICAYLWSSASGGQGTSAVWFGRIFLAMCLFAITGVELWLVSRIVTASVMTAAPPIVHVQESPIRKILAEHAEPVRLLAPGANIANLFGVASTPVYLTFGPAAYLDPDTIMPTPPEAQSAAVSVSASPEQIGWLQRAGVTHVLSENPLNRTKWPVRLLWRGFDPFLHRAWGRGIETPLYLYSIEYIGAKRRGRVDFAEPKTGDSARVTEYRANRVTIEAESNLGGPLVLTDLMFPGWEVTVDGQEAEAVEFERMYRAVELSPGRHTVVWSYQPHSFYWGAAVSLVSLVVLAIVAHLLFWHPKRFAFLIRAAGIESSQMEE